MAKGNGLARKAIEAAGRAAGGYQAHRDDLEPLIRLVTDVLALAAVVLRPRPAPAATQCAEGERS